MVAALRVNFYVTSGRVLAHSYTKVVDFVHATSLEFEVVTADDNRIHRVIGDRRLDSSTFQEALALWAPLRRAHRQTAESGRLTRAGPGANRCGRRCNSAGSLPWEIFFLFFSFVSSHRGGGHGGVITSLIQSFLPSLPVRIGF